MTRRRVLTLQALVVALALALGQWVPQFVGAQTGAQITVDPSSFAPGDVNSVTVTGSGFTPNQDISVSYIASEGGNPTPESASPDPISDSNGAFTTQVPVPTDIDPGNYSVAAIGGTSFDFATATFTVTAPAGSTDTPTPVASGTVTDTPIAT